MTKPFLGEDLRRMRLGKCGYNGITHAGRADLGAAFLVDIASAEALGDNLFASGFDGLCCFFFLEGVAEHEGHGEDLGERVSDALASDIRSGTTGRFVQTEAPFGDRSGREEAHGAGEHCAFVGEDVAEEVRAEQHVEFTRALEELHGGVIDVEVFESQFRIVLDDFVHDFAPEHARGEHVGLVDRSNLLVAQHCGVESEAGNAFDFVAAVLHGVKADFFLGARNAFAALRLAKVNVTRQFADGEDVEAVAHDVCAERASTGEFLIDAGRAEVAEKLEMLTEREQGTAFRLQVRGEVFPLRATHGTEKNTVRSFTQLEGAFRQRRTAFVVGGATDVCPFGVHVEAELLGNHVQHADSFFHHFRTDTVARKHCNLVILAHC